MKMSACIIHCILMLHARPPHPAWSDTHHGRVSRPPATRLTMWIPRLFRVDEEIATGKMGRGGEFAVDEEVIRRLVERIIKVEVQQETLKRQVEDSFVGNDFLGFGENGENNRLILWNRILRLEEGHKMIEKHVQELFANVMDFELQSRGEPCHLHNEGITDNTDNSGNTKQKKDWRQWFEKSMKKSSISVASYLMKPQSLTTRLVWTSILVVCAILSSACIYNTYRQWTEHPVLLDHDTLAPLGLIPFPAVTVCPGRSIRDLRPLDTLIHRCDTDECTDLDVEKISAAAFLCPSLLERVTLKAWTNYFNSSCSAFLEELIPPCSQEISSFHWPERPTELCTNTFQTTFVDHRFCFSYNVLPAKQLFNSEVSSIPFVIDNTGLTARGCWRPDILHRPVGTDKTIPLHLESAGENHKFTIALKGQSRHFDKECNKDPDFYQIAVHHPAELAGRVTHRYLRLPPGHSLYVAITPRLTIDSASSRCVSPGPGGSRVFQHYSQSNCLLECRARCTLSLCGCVPLNLPRVSNSTKWCGLSRQHCFASLVTDLLKGKITWELIAKHYRKSIREELHEAITSHMYHFPGQEGLTVQVLQRLAPDCTCDCLPSCTTLSYSLDTQLVPLDADNRTLQNRSEVHVYYKEGLDYFTISERKTVFTFTSFLAHTGGLLALFTGISLVTLAELLYLLVGSSPTRTEGAAGPQETEQCRRRREWDKPAQTDPLFITESSFTIAL